MLNLIKGWIGEKTVTLGMWMGLDADIYKRVHDVIIPSANGTTQIDHILVSKFGLFVIETKNYQGWIFGAENQPEWTQVIFGKKTRFQNPLRQNYRHTKCLSDYLSVEHELVFPVVMFIGDAVLKTAMPPNVMTEGLGTFIRSFQRQCFSDQNVAQIHDRLLALKKNPPTTRREHLQSLHVRHASDTDCPKCGAELKRKTAKKGPNAGGEFLGCSRYPDCKFTKNIS